MKQPLESDKRISRVKSIVIGGVLIWTAIMASSLLWNIVYTENQTMAKADMMARLAFDKDLTFRSWVTFHGGVYVPVTGETQPNPYLHVPGRDEVTQSGKAITLMNPAYVMRQYYEKFGKKTGPKGHLTSLKPLRPENRPDPWEQQALRDFETGRQETTTVQIINGDEYVRLMKPVLTEKGCLKCHAQQGYREGNIRGGISVSVPMAPLLKLQSDQIGQLSVIHAFIWSFGLAGMILFGNRILKSERHQVQVEQNLRISEEKLLKVFQASPDWITITTLADGRYIDVNDAFVSRTGYSREQIIGKSADELGLWVKPNEGQKAREILAEQGVLHDFEIDCRMRSGKIHTMLWSAEMIELTGQRHFVSAIKDITKRKEMEQEIERIAYHDSLTGLPNRLLFIDRLTVAMNQALRNQKRVALMMLDLDMFKEVNDTLGHHRGDMLLMDVAERLKDVLRKGDTVARFGGDEFIIVLTDQNDAEDALQVAQKIVASFQVPFSLEEHRRIITASIGIALFPDHGRDIDTVLRNADSAMYSAKASGRNQFIIYSGGESTA